MKTTSSILVVGSSNTDMTVKLNRLPKPGETILGGDFVSSAGGKGANQAVAAARSGGRVTLLARVGSDSIGNTAVAGFKADKINVKYIVRDAAAPSGVALIFIGNNGENSIAVASGANARLTPADLKKAAPAFRSARVVVLQLEVPLKTVEAAAEMADAAGIPVVLNPAPAQWLPASLLRRVFALTPNESETELLTGVKVTDPTSAAKAARELLARGVRNVIITMGSAGVFLAGTEGQHCIPGFKVNPVDTTAAGDVFNGAFSVALAEGQSLVQAARFANAAAAISVTRRGAQASAPTRAEIERMLIGGRVQLPASPVRRNGGRNHRLTDSTFKSL